MNDTAQQMERIKEIPDLLEKALMLSGLVTRLFREAGWDLVVVGGSAVEFYTEGSYMSGDIDFCRQTIKPIPLRLAQDIMSKLGAAGGPRSWKVAGLYVDMLGLLENEAKTPCREVATPCGSIRIVSTELVIVERVLLSCYPQPDPEAEVVARKMLAVCLAGATPVDWAEVERLAALPSFNVRKELKALIKKVKSENRRKA